MDDQEKDQLMKRADRIIRRINPLLQGVGPEVQGAVLVDLVSRFFAGHHPAIREDMIEMWMKAMRGLIPVNEAAIFKHYGGKPEGWEPN